MRAFGNKRNFLWLLLVVLICCNGVPRFAFADDDKESSNSTAKPAPVKIENPAPGLTERERWLLDRVEQLEKRVAELEAKGQPATAAALVSQTATVNVIAQPASANVAAPSGTAETTAAASTNAVPAPFTHASISPQDAEKSN